MEKFIDDKGRRRELVRVVSADSECGYVTTYRDAMKDGDVEFRVKVEPGNTITNEAGAVAAMTKKADEDFLRQRAVTKSKK